MAANTVLKTNSQILHACFCSWCMCLLADLDNKLQATQACSIMMSICLVCIVYQYWKRSVLWNAKGLTCEISGVCEKQEFAFWQIWLIDWLMWPLRKERENSQDLLLQNHSTYNCLSFPSSSKIFIGSLVISVVSRDLC